mgnify:CR=1 FL=1
MTRDVGQRQLYFYPGYLPRSSRHHHDRKDFNQRSGFLSIAALVSPAAAAIGQLTAALRGAMPADGALPMGRIASAKRSGPTPGVTSDRAESPSPASTRRARW